jgi:hypothetical protein
MAEENRSWGYDRIVGALANLGHEVSDQTVGNVLQRHSLPPAPERKHTTTLRPFRSVHFRAKVQIPAKTANGRSFLNANHVGVFFGLVSAYSQNDVHGMRMSA